jgi:peptidoglycan-N-acetylglucosamine deacetylase
MPKGHLGAAPGTLSLTFDDGPDPVWSRRVLKILERVEARATFFMAGEQVLRSPETVRAIVDAGHDVQLHTHCHVRHSELSEDEIAQDTSRALRVLQRVGVRPWLWRTPWGVCTAATERVAERHGLTLVGWSIDTHDWRGDPASAMLDRALDHLRPGAIVLMHDALGPGALRTGCENTLELLEPLIAAARAAGLGVGPPTFEHAALLVPQIPTQENAAARTMTGSAS